MHWNFIDASLNFDQTLDLSVPQLMKSSFVEYSFNKNTGGFTRAGIQTKKDVLKLLLLTAIVTRLDLSKYE